MTDVETIHTPSRRRSSLGSHLLSAGAGATGGGLLVSLFGTLKVGDTFKDPLIASPGYPLAIFSVVALFVLIAGLFTMHVSTRQFIGAMCGVVLFSVAGAAGGLMVYRDAQQHHRIRISEHFEPDLAAYSESLRDSRDPIRLSIEFSSDRLTGSTDSYRPFANGRYPMVDGDNVDFRIKGLDALWDRYRGLKYYFAGVCANSSDPICKSYLHEGPQ